jgi:hypothetical protein
MVAFVLGALALVIVGLAEGKVSTQAAEASYRAEGSCSRGKRRAAPSNKRVTLIPRARTTATHRWPQGSTSGWGKATVTTPDEREGR